MSTSEKLPPQNPAKSVSAQQQNTGAAVPIPAAVPGTASVANEKESVEPTAASVAAEVSSSGAQVAGTPGQEELLQEILKQVTPSKRAVATEPASPRPPQPPGPPKPPRPPSGGDGEPSLPPTLHDKVDDLTQTTLRIESAVGKLEPIEQTLGKSHTLLEKTAHEVDRIKADLATGVKELHGDVDKIGRELTPILGDAQRERNELRQTLASTQKRIVKSLHNATETRREVQAVQQTLNESENKAVTYRDELKKDYGETAKALANLAGRVNERLIPDVKLLGDKLKEHADRTAPVLEDVNRRLGTVESSLKDSVLPQAAKITEAVDKLASDTRQLDKNLRNVHTEFQQTLVADLDKSLSKAAGASALDKLSRHTEQEFKEVSRKQELAQKILDGLHHALPDDLGGWLGKLAEGLRSLENMGTASEKSLEDLGERVENIEKSVGNQLEQKLAEVEYAIVAAQKTLGTVATAAEVQLINRDLEVVQSELLSAIELVETRLGGKLDAALGVAQQAAEDVAASAVGELKEPVGAVKRSVGDALEYRLGLVQRDLGELGKELKGKLDALTSDVALTHGTLSRTVVPGLEQAKAATEAVGARLDKRSERLEAAVAEAAKSVGKAVKERVEGVAQSVSQLGSQRIQDQTALVQQLNQLRTDVTGPLSKLGAVVADGLTQRIDHQSGALAELQRGTTQRLGELSTTLTTVKQTTSMLGDDLSAALSTLDKLAAAVPLHQTALLGELATVRTMLQDGLVGTLRNSSKDLQDQVLALDDKVEIRVDAVKSQLGQLADRGAQQHAQVVADVSAIRDLVRTDGGIQGRLAEAMHRKLDETQLCVTVLATGTKHQHEAVLSNLDQVQNSVTSLKSLETSIEKMFVRLKENIEANFDKKEADFDKKLNARVLEIMGKSQPIHDYITSLKEAANRDDFTKQLQQNLAANFMSLEQKLNPLAAFLKNEEVKLDSIKRRSDQNGEELNLIKATSAEVKEKTGDISFMLAEHLKGKLTLPNTIRQLLLNCAFIGFLALMIFMLKSCGVDIIHSGAPADEKLADILKGQEELKKYGEKTDKLLCLAEKTTRKLGSTEATLDAQLAEIRALLPKSVNKGRALPPLPLPPAPQVTNNISLCSACGAGSQGGSTTNCTCLGKTTTSASEPSASPEQKAPKPATLAPATTPPKK